MEFQIRLIHYDQISMKNKHLATENRGNSTAQSQQI
jgi:hypothetical protein